ncbi:ABC transporter ATP-binding protein/permease [Paracoccus xiamenensis]|uniref:ABC transporter ATP-binding protein/permease n=1 Tax=Paracoccus xiamenensis TaxID=2714901 RepID=UPI0014088154|nr:ATP-binding cassette domain-containing protein [Paracoccus xiamenensis]NHF72714.1 ATP-binding cassette domain-containing protein [Paracoccus xiamenensis]
MSRQPSPSASAARQIEAPLRGQLARASALSVAAGLVWPLQAAAVAWAIAGWVAGDLTRTLLAAAIFLAGTMLRAVLDHIAGGILFRAGDRALADARARLIDREFAAPGPARSAAMAALVAEKLPLLLPWITRYRPAMARARVIPLVYIAIAAVIAWPAALVLAVAGPLIPVFMALIGMAAESASRRHLAEIGSLNALLMERLGALIDLRLLGAGDRARADFDARAEGLRARTMAVLRIAFLSSTVLELFAAIGVALMAVYVGFTLLGVLNFGTWGRGMGVAEGVLLLLLAPDFFQPLRDLAAAWHDRAAGLAVAAELTEAEDAPRQPMLGQGAPATPLPGRLRLRLRDAVAALPGGARLFLPDLDLDAGQSLAISGASGAGKSTLLGVVAGLVPLDVGRVEVAGQNLDAGNADAWRARLAVMPQGMHLPDLALGDWLGAGDPTAALRLAGAEGIVARLPDALRSRLGETGGGVSGGEARRLLLARAIHAGRELLIADEPTADLDRETAAHVIASLRALQAQGRTLLVASHDPALLAAMDREVRL